MLLDLHVLPGGWLATLAMVGVPAGSGDSTRKNLVGPWPQGVKKENGGLGAKTPENCFGHALFVPEKTPLLRAEAGPLYTKKLCK